MIRADLGPTNTGKTHRAIERMLQFRSGVIGLPLRLLAREVYDRICAKIDPDKVALITGEERIIGKSPQYWVATVEAMPRELRPEIVIVDEIQLCADPERGHIFTDRLLHLRGQKETLFLGSEVMRAMIQRFIPETIFETSARMSKLSWMGRKKLSNLPTRSAIVAFSTDEVYATAEFLRRQHGGAAVVMGMLSPRTRNAQVELYQSGQVDYLVATDAIGMGLNLDIKHVFFAGTEKFDGRRHRELFPHELGQIAGRAGRFSQDGYFGITGTASQLDEQVINAIEGHRFASIKSLEWRNSDLNFASLDALLASLERASPNQALNRTRESDDLRVLRHMSRLEHVRAKTQHPAHVSLLWDVCGLPDFPKFAAGEHLALCERIYADLRSTSGRINPEFAHKSVENLAIPHQNIEILARKLAQIRTWTYIAQRNDWLSDAGAWRKRTREVEDMLSDALHHALMQNFIDERTSKLRKRLKEKDVLMAEVNENGEVTIEGNFVGRLHGFRFELDPSAVGAEAKTMASAAKEALAPVFHLRSDKFYNAADKDISFSQSYAIMWNDAPIAALKKGANALEPEVNLLVDEGLSQDIKDKISRRIGHWLERRRQEQLAPLLAIQNDETLSGLVRGVGFQLVEALGVVPREQIAEDIKNLSQDDRKLLRAHGVRFGQFTIFCPLLLKPAPTEFRLALSSIWREEAEQITPPSAGLVTVIADESYLPHHYPLSGYKRVGARAIRVDMLERLADLLRDKDANAGFEATADMLSITGLTLEQLADVMQNIGYEAEKGEREAPAKAPKEGEAQADALENADAGEASAPAQEVFYIFKRARKGSKPKPKGNFKKPKNPVKKASAPQVRKEKPIDPDNPFAALAALKKS